MRCLCPQCSEEILQIKNSEGPNFCPNCHALFYAPRQNRTPSWILGVLVVLVASLQLCYL